MMIADICMKFPDIEFKFGDYPYAACYSSEAYKSGKWLDCWFCNSEFDFVIYIPDHYSNEKKIWSLLHELGHYHSDSDNESFYEEALAWAWAEQFMRDNGIEITKDYYVFRQGCLQTYYEEC